jgi:peptidoglycan hydrolase-like protein with peptidoglycan-binding domain
MMKVRNLAALMALSSIAVLPACSWLGIGDNNRQTSHVTPASQSYAASPATAPELTPDMIRSVQQNLQQGGLYHGRVDGVWGPSTQAAVRTYQQQHNMNATGQLDQATLAAMNLGPAQSNAAQEQPANQTYGSSYNPTAPNNASNPQPGTPNPPNTITTR